MATKVQIPDVGESVSEVVLVEWLKADGERVDADEPICILETEKADVELPSPAAGILHTVKAPGDAIHVGETIARIDNSTGEDAEAKPTAPSRNEKAPETKTQREEAAPPFTSPRAEESRAERPSQKEVEKAKPEAAAAEAPSEEKLAAEEEIPTESEPEAEPQPQKTISPRAAPTRPALLSESFGEDGTRRVAMSKIRRRIAERLVEAQHTAAMLTTFNEVDVRSVIELRDRHKARFEKTHGVSLGLTSFFARACVLALKEFPRLNARIDGDAIVYHQFVHLGIAVSTDRGLVVPVLRHAESLSFAQIELEIKRLANAARAGKLSIDELSGGTFSITNGGIFGSLLSTPILNPPQTGILGMHVIQKRPVAVNDQVEIRPMMYVALTYDHRLVDGKESVSFLVRVKERIEDPARLVLEV